MLVFFRRPSLLLIGDAWSECLGSHGRGNMSGFMGASEIVITCHQVYLHEREGTPDVERMKPEPSAQGFHTSSPRKKVGNKALVRQSIFHCTHQRSPCPNTSPTPAGSPPSAVAIPIAFLEKLASFMEAFSASDCAMFLTRLAPMPLEHMAKDWRVRLVRSVVANAMPDWVPSSLRERSRWRSVLFRFRIAENSLPAFVLVDALTKLRKSVIHHRGHKGKEGRRERRDGGI